MKSEELEQKYNAMAHSDRWKVLVKEFPCLYDTNNPDFLNEELKARCLEQLLERCNNEGDQTDMETLKQRVSGLLLVTTWHNNIVPQARVSRQQAHNDLLLDMATNFPCLWNPKDSDYNNDEVRSQCQEQLLQLYNSRSYSKITMAGLQQKIEGVNLYLRLQSAYSRGPPSKNAKRDRLLELAQEFPCLWDCQDLNFRDEAVKKRSYKQLLEKCNRELSEPITMVDLKRKFYNMINRMKYRINRTKYRWENAGEEYSPEITTVQNDRIMELAQEFPCLWDTEHLNFRNRTLKRRNYQQLLEKYNNVAVKESAAQITVKDLKKKLLNLRRRLKWRQECRKKERSSWKDKGKKKKRECRGPETGQASSSRPHKQTSIDLMTENNSDDEPLVNLREDAVPPVILQGTEIVFNWCCFCGEIRNDCHPLTHNKPYVTTNKVILTMSDINVEVDFRKNTTPQAVCQSCDRNLQEMYEFIKRIQKAQDKFSNVSNIDDLRESPVILNDNPPYISTSDDDDDKGDVIYDFLSISDTEFTNTKVSACKRKNNKEEVAASRKKFRVSIDLNSISSPCDDSNVSNDIDLNCNKETGALVETTRLVNKVNESVFIKEEIIESPGDTTDKEAFNAENAIQRTEKQQNTTTSSSETRNKLVSETNSVFVNDQETARESISAVKFADYALNTANEDVETLVVHHTIRTRMQPSEVQKQVASEINSIVVTNNSSPKEAITADDRKKVSENAKTIVIKQECIVLSDDEDNSDVQPNIKTKLEPAEVQDTQVLVSDTSKLLGSSQKELSNDTTGLNGSSVSVNQPTSEPVCVIPKSYLMAIIESTVSRMLNK